MDFIGRAPVGIFECSPIVTTEEIARENSVIVPVKIVRIISMETTRDYSVGVLKYVPKENSRDTPVSIP